MKPEVVMAKVLWLRSTLYVGDFPIATAVFREPDLEMRGENIYTIATRMRYEDPVGATDVEVFEHEDDVQSAVAEAERRGRNRLNKEQRNRMAFHDWVLGCLPMVREGGTIATKDPTPLSVSEIEETFAKAVKSKWYKKHRLIGISESGEVVVFCHCESEGV